MCTESIKTQCINCSWTGQTHQLGKGDRPNSETYCPSCGLFDFLIDDDELDQMNEDEPLPTLDRFLSLSCLA